MRGVARRARLRSIEDRHRLSQGRQRTAFAALWVTFAAVVSVVSVVVALLSPAPAYAGPLRLRFPVRLEYTRGPGAEHCPDEAFLRAEMTRRLGDLDAFQPDAPYTVTAIVTRDGAALLAEMRLRDPTGTIVWVDGFEATGPCEALVSAMAVTLVVEIETVAGTLADHAGAAEPTNRASAPPAPQVGPAESGPPPGLSSAPASTPAPVELRRGSPRVSEPPRLRLEGGLGAVVAFGITPGAAGGMALSIAARGSEGSVGLEARALGAYSQEVDGVLVETSVFTAAVVGCLHHRILFACGLAEVGAYRFSAEGLVDAGPGDQRLVALAARAGGEWPLSTSFSVRAYVDLVETFRDAKLRRRPGADPASGRVLWDASTLGLALGLAATVRY